MPRKLAVPALATAGALAVVVGSFLPWLRSGRRARSSYELYGLARRLDFATGAVARGGVWVWPVVPVLAVAVVLTAWRPAAAVSAVLGAATALYVGAVCVVAWRAPLPAQAGVVVTFAGAVALVAASGARVLERDG